MKTVELTVEGMMCAGCENRVSKALSEVDGMINVKADAQGHKVTCEFDETKTTLNVIKETIEDVGYDVIA